MTGIVFLDIGWMVPWKFLFEVLLNSGSSWNQGWIIGVSFISFSLFDWMNSQWMGILIYLSMILFMGNEKWFGECLLLLLQVTEMIWRSSTLFLVLLDEQSWRVIVMMLKREILGNINYGMVT